MTVFRKILYSTLSIGLVAGLAGIARAQDDPPLAGKKPPPKQDAGGKDAKGDKGDKSDADEGDRGPGRRARGPGADRMLDRLSEELKLTDEQKTKIREIMSKRFNRAQQGEGAAPNFERMRELREEMQQAREAGDEAKMKELRDKMAAARDAMEKSRDEMNKEIEAVLTPEQKEKFAQIREDMAQRFGRGPRPGSDPRSLRQAVLSLDLGKEQRAKIEAIIKKGMKEIADLPDGDRQARANVMRDLRDEVMKELTKEQQAQLREKLDAGGRLGPGGGRRGGDDGAADDRPARRRGDRKPAENDDGK